MFEKFQCDQAISERNRVAMCNELIQIQAAMKFKERDSLKLAYWIIDQPKWPFHWKITSAEFETITLTE